MLALLGAGAGAAYSLTPPVGDAPRRVAALAAAHGVATLDALPDRVATAVLAVEDHRFYHHPGIDPIALARVADGMVTGHDEGGATIEVQLAKWLYTNGHADPAAQAEQTILAPKLDLAYPKSQILLMYLNTVYFGHGYYGVAAACQGYFGRSPDQLDWAQAALVAGLLQAPDAFDPRVHPQAAKTRRHEALNRLLATGAITAAQRAQADSSPLELAPP
jgi:penicillin-binding protein 1A